MELFGQRQQRLAEQRHLLRVHGDLAAARAEYEALHGDDIAHIPAFLHLAVFLLAHVVHTDVDPVSYTHLVARRNIVVGDHFHAIAGMASVLIAFEKL